MASQDAVVSLARGNQLAATHRGGPQPMRRMGFWFMFHGCPNPEPANAIVGEFIPKYEVESNHLDDEDKQRKCAFPTESASIIDFEEEEMPLSLKALVC